LTAARSSEFHSNGYRALITASGLKLNAVAFSEILESHPWGQAPSMEEHIVTSVIWFDEAKAFVSHNFLNGAGHCCPPRKSFS
jgi:hypothetical protein